MRVEQDASRVLGVGPNKQSGTGRLAQGGCAVALNDVESGVERR